jgi:hypothetical protein
VLEVPLLLQQDVCMMLHALRCMHWALPARDLASLVQLLRRGSETRSFAPA